MDLVQIITDKESGHIHTAKKNDGWNQSDDGFEKRHSHQPDDGGGGDAK